MGELKYIHEHRKMSNEELLEAFEYVKNHFPAHIYAWSQESGVPIYRLFEEAGVARRTYHKWAAKANGSQIRLRSLLDITGAMVSLHT